jgi:hypothetical protein
MWAIGSISCAMAERLQLHEKHKLNRARGVVTSNDDTQYDLGGNYVLLIGEHHLLAKTRK